MRRLALLLWVASCSESAEPAVVGPDAANSVDAHVAEPEDVAQPEDAAVPELDAGPAYQPPGFCARPGDDIVRDLFCAEQAPQLTSLRELFIHLEVNASIGTDTGYVEDSNSFVDTAVFLGHSTALSGRLVSPINPRAIVFGRNALMTFQRGVQQVEIAAAGRNQGFPNFYLLQFAQACNDTTCTPTDLFSPRVEANWQRVSIRDAEELKNTTFDCRQCHQRGRDTPMLLMRELEAPWTHFFELDASGYEPGVLPGVRGVDLVRDYKQAKGNESYAGLSAFTLSHSFGILLQNIVARDQPLLFDAPKIEEERWPFDAVNGVYPATPRSSPSWEAAYEAFKRGEQLAMPHFEPRPTDPAKQAALIDAYQRFRAGTLKELPDLSDIFPDDPMQRARIGLQNEPGATPAQALVQVCASCHNDVLDQTISRARFNVALARMSAEERASAIDRLQRDAHAPGAMPPAESRQLDPEARAKLIEYLRQDTRADDAFLTRAASLGMTGGGKP